MDAFLSIVVSFPTIIWTGLLLFCLLYWAIALIGLADFDAPEIDPDLPDGGLEGVAGLLVSLGLDGVPLSVALTAVSLSGWTCSYFLDLLFLHSLSTGVLLVVGGVVALVISSVLSVKLASLMIRPLKPLFRDSKASNNDVLGKTGIVVYATSEQAGVIDCTVNGAHLRLEARSRSPIAAGEKAVVIKYHKHDAVYQVVPETDFLTGVTR